MASTGGFAYQPLVSAGGTANISGLGTVQSVAIGNSGSGYRVGVQTVVNVYTQVAMLGTPEVVSIGTASIENGHIVSVAVTNGVGGYTPTNPPEIIFDDPSLHQYPT